MTTRAGHWCALVARWESGGLITDHGRCSLPGSNRKKGQQQLRSLPVVAELPFQKN